MAPQKVVRLETDAGVATLTLCDPNGLNPISEPLLIQLPALLREATADPEVKVILLRAEGAAFSVGASMEFLASDNGSIHDWILGIGDALNEVIRVLHRARQVTIAAVAGAAGGGGLGLMLACDLVLLAKDTTLSVAYGRIGFSPDAGVSYLLARDVGYRRALGLYLTSERFDAERALELGLANRLVAAERLDEEAADLAARIAAGPTTAFAQAKRLFKRAARESLESQLEDEIRTVADLSLTAEFRQGVSAFIDGSSR